MPPGRIAAILFLLLCALLTVHCLLPGQVVEAAPGVTETTPVKDRIRRILGDILILSLYGFPLSIAEGWALAHLTEARQQPAKEAPAPTDDWTAWLECLPRWLREPHRVGRGLVAGGCLTVVVLVVGAAALALFYHSSGQPEQVSQVLPRFAYWLPFGLLGLVTDIPFQVFEWADKRQRVLLRLALWWFPRVVIFAFVFNPPFLRNLDPVTTALTVLAVDAALAAFFLWLHRSRKRRGTRAPQQD
jgi:hypothetical protein